MRKLMLTLVVAIGSIGPLNADVLTYTVTPNAGQFAYEFTLTNTGDTGGTLFDLFLSLPTDIANIDTATIGTPVGWGDPTGGLLFFGPDTVGSTSFIEWASDASGTYDLGIGSSLGGFSFRSSVDVGQPITFALNGSTEFATAQEVSSVPEPGTIILLIPILVAAAFWTRLRPVRP
jgi:hypothetical protein